MSTETQECEANIAFAWFIGTYNQDQAQRTCEIQSLDFNNVMNKYGRLYALEQSSNEGYHNVDAR